MTLCHGVQYRRAPFVFGTMQTLTTLLWLLGCPQPTEVDPSASTTLSPPVADPPDPPNPFATDVETGPLVGVETPAGAVAYLGIPFAAPPIGDQRFRPPAPPAPWAEPRVADQFAEACIQYDEAAEAVRGSEDCLYLNVWRPDPFVQSLPVLVFIHGGGNVVGSAAEETSPGFKIYDGAWMAAQASVVVVTLQYRLNALGYLADPSLDSDVPSGNYGPRDQVAALEWVQRNIGAFGGDPDRVLLFGESGGAADVCGLLATPSAAGLFHAASIMSGGCRGYDRADLLALGAEAATAVGCDAATDRAACLRAADASALVEAVQRPSALGGFVTAWAGPTIDGSFLPQSPDAAILAGEHHRVPLLIGTTADETSSPIFGIPFTLTEEQYESTVSLLFGADADAVLAQYPRSAFPTPRDALVALTTDAQFTCTTRTTALDAGAWSPVYHYVYEHVYDGETSALVHPRIFGAAHGFELPVLFQTLATYDDYVPSKSETQLGQEMTELWAEFAASGAPSETWPEHDGLYTMTLSADRRVVEDYRGEQCALWNALAE